jgi:hypothetical protein
VIWTDPENKIILSFELKTDKEEPTTYRKKEDIGQGHDHISWTEEKHPDYEHLGLIFVGPIGCCTVQSNPSDNMYHCTIKDIQTLRNNLLAALTSIRKCLPIERANRVKDFYSKQRNDLRGLFGQLAKRRMKENQEQPAVI